MVSDFLYGVLTVSVMVNMWALGKVSELRVILRKTDNMLRDVAKGKARITKKLDQRGEIDWGVEKL